LRREVRVTLITDPKINDYLMKLSCGGDKLALDMEKQARKRDFPIVDRLVGRLLYLITKVKNPRLIVELGSGYGYSAYWFARALGRGKVILTDSDEGNIGQAKKIFLEAGLERKAEFRTGNAIDIALQYEKIDILFIDIDKHQYPDAVKNLLPNLNKNGLIIADNTLWYGKVTGRSRDRDTQGIKEFNEYMFSNSDFFTTIVPLRDGVLIAYKVS
jgi:caffeoyl-CoA O-methyltransferase